MNDQIKKLMMQSWNTHHNSVVNGIRYPVVQKFDAEKFAKLILVEVTDILSSYRGKVIFEDGAEYNYEHPIIAIHKHFGVEE